MRWRRTSEQSELAELGRHAQRARETLASLPHGSRSQAIILYAAAPTERLFRRYDGDPDSYGLTWRPVLDSVWAHLEGDESAYARISRALGEFYLSPYSNNGYEGPDDIDQDEAAATFYTANCVVHGLVDFALWSATRATDNLETRWYGIDEPRRRREVATELDRQTADLALIATAARATPPLNQGVPADLITRLRAP